MRQLVSMVTEQGVSYYIADGEDGPIVQIAQTINPGLDASGIVRLGVMLGDTLAVEPEPIVRKPKQRVKATHERRGIGRPRADGQPNQAWGYTQAAVYETLRKHGACVLEDVIARFGHDPSDRRARAAMSTALSSGYRQGTISRETLEPYTPGNPTQYTRTRYSAVIVEPEREQLALDDTSA